MTSFPNLSFSILTNISAAQLALRPSVVQAFQSQATQRSSLSQKDLDRERVLAPAVRSNRARMETSNASYSVAPRSTFDSSKVDPSTKPIGASGMDAFRKMTAKQGKKRS